ncbi:MAG: alpha/beta hydrolase [Shimia sp.]|nr:alpha/beta hydrolase [Shimia sp.]
MRFLIRLAVILGLMFGATLVLGNVAERWLIYPFDGTYVTPNEAGLLNVTEHKLSISDNTLVVWTAPPRGGKPVVFYLHGNAGNLAVRSGRFQRFLDRGYGLIALAYPGSSGSSGTPSEESLSRAARHVWDERAALLPDLNFGTVIYGESLGTAVALHLAAALKTAPTAIILEAPFTSIPAMAEHHYTGTGALAKNLQNQWNSLSAATDIHVPLFIMHGTNDTLIPIEMGRQIHAAAPSNSKQFLAVKGAGHTDLWRSDTLPKLFAFIDQFALR